MRRFLFLLAVIFLSPLSFYAQVSGYSYSSTSGTYTPITGGLVLGDASSDDQRFVDPATLLGGTTNTGPGFSIGFNFVYNGVTYDKVGVNANGWITLGSGTVNVGATTLGISSTASTNVLAPFTRDLQSQTGGEIRVQTIGTTPNQQLVVQWTNYKRYGSTGTGDALNFQVILNEVDNSIQFVYGSCTTTATSTTADPQVGLKGASTSDYLNFDGTFAALTMGTSSSANVDFDNTTGPTNGQTITFTAPTCFSPTGLSASNIQTGSADLSWTTGGASNWVVEYGTSGFTLGTGTKVNTATTTLSISGLSANTVYQFYVKDSCGVGDVSNYAGPFSFTTPCAAVTTYPWSEDFETSTSTIPSCWVNATGDNADWIFRTGSIGHGSTGDHTTGTGYYAGVDDSHSSVNDTVNNLLLPPMDLTSLTTPRLSFYYFIGNDATLTSTIHVDIFDGSSWNLKVATINFSSAAWLLHRMDITPYKSAATQIRLRVVETTDFNSDVSIDDVVVEETPSCAMPTSLGVASVTSSSASVYWTTGGASAWNIEYGPAGFTPGSGTIMAATNDTATISGLTDLSDYEFYVQDDCGGSTSLFAGPYQFTTTCALALNGTYTINSGAATGGSNFNTFTEAITRLNGCGVSGAVVFNVAQGTYNERFVIDSIAGASSTNTVTIQADAANTMPVVLRDSATSSSENYIIEFNNANYITVDGITMTALGASYSRVIDFSSSNNDITIQNCILNAVEAGSTSTNHAVVYDNTGSSNKAMNIIIHANEINNGSYGVYLYGVSTSDFESGHMVTDNTIQNFYNYGIRTYYQDGVVISGNTITSSTSASTTVYGIYNGYSDNSTVSSNTIVVSGSSTNYGIYNYYNDATALAPNVVANNMITTLANTGSTYGIYPYNNYYTDIVYNSVNITAGSATAGRALYINSSSSGTYGNVNIMNNNLVNTGGGYVGEVSSNAVTLGYVTSSDYNNFYGTGSTLVRIGSTDFVDLASYQLGASIDANSVSADPLFANVDDLHVSSPSLNAAASVYASITVDIDGDVRSATPDIGADEFTPPSCVQSGSLMVDAVTSSSADVSWTSGTGTTFIVEYGTAGFTLGSGTQITAILDTFTTISGLSGNTAYEFYVQDDCAAQGTSPFVGPVSFTTLPTPVTLPYSEDFEGVINNLAISNGADALAMVDTFGCSSMKSVLFTGGSSSGWSGGSTSTSATQAWDQNTTKHSQVLMAVDASSATTFLTLEFDLVQQYSFGPDYSWFRVMVNDTDQVSPDYQPSTATGDTCEHMVIDLSAYAGTTFSLKFQGAKKYAIGTGTANGDNAWLDNISIFAPSCNTPSAIGANNITNTSADIYWTTGGASNWNIEYGPVGFTPGTGTMVAASNDTTTLGSLMAATNYDIYVRDSCGAGNVSAWVGPFSFSTAVCPASSACTFTASMSDSWGDGWNGTEVTVYQNNVAVAVLGPNFTTGTAWTESVSLCDGVQAHLVISFATTNTYPEEIGVDMIDPYTLLAASYGANPAAMQGDTIISFMPSCAAPACAPPLNVGSYNITGTSADLYWTATAASFNIEYGAPGFTPGTGTMTVSTNDTMVLSGLMSSSCYEFYVQSDCSTDSSVWVGPFSFCTLCLPVTSYPYVQDFSSAIVGNPAGMPSCFTATATASNGSYNWYPNSGATTSGSTGPDFDHTTGAGIYVYTEASSPAAAGDSAMLTLPEFDLTSLSVPEISFWYHMYGQSILNLNLEVYNTTTMSWDSIYGIAGEQQTANSDPWLEARVDLSAYGSATALQMRFITVRGASFYGDVAIDDIVVRETPLCLDPTGFAVGAVGLNDVSLSWNSDTSVSHSVIEYGIQGFVQGTGTMMPATGGMTTINMLMPGTCYDFYVLDSCSGGATNWVGPVTACTSTPCSVTGVPTAVTSDTTNCGGGIVTLTAAQNNVAWMSGGYVVGTGSTYTSDSLTATTNYEAALYNTAGLGIHVGPMPSIAASGFGNFTNGQWITALDTIRIDSTTVRANGYVEAQVQIWDPSGTQLIQVGEIFTTDSAVTANYQVEVGIVLTPGTYYMNVGFGNTVGALFRATGGAVYPYVAPGLLSIDSVNFAGPRFYYTFDLVVSGACLGTGVPTVGFVPGPNAGTSDTVSVCGTNTMVDLSSYLGTHDPGGTWYDVNSTGAVSVGIFDASMVSAGTYNFIYGLPSIAGCAGDSATITVNVVSAAGAGSDTTHRVCGTVSTLNMRSLLPGSSTGGSWLDLDNSGGLVGNTLFVSSVSTGTYHFVYYTPAGICPGDSATITLHVDALLNLGADVSDTICDSLAAVDLATYLGAGVSGGSWLDISGTSALSGSMFNPSAVSFGQTYTFRYMLTNGCGTDSVDVNLYVAHCPIGIKEYTTQAMMVYPNPTNGILTIKTKGAVVSDMKVEVGAVNGQILMRQSSQGDDFMQIDLSNLPKGIYNVRIISDLGVEVHQISKM